MIVQGLPFVSIVSMARTSPTFLASNVCPVLLLMSEISVDGVDRFALKQSTDSDGRALQQKDALRHAPVYWVRKRGSGLVRDRIGIGRDQNADICIPNARMSRYHAFFSKTSGPDWVLTDANSKNGSWVEGNRLAAGASCVLPDATSIALGGIEFVFYLPEKFVALCRTFSLADSDATFPAQD